VCTDIAVDVAIGDVASNDVAVDVAIGDVASNDVAGDVAIGDVASNDVAVDVAIGDVASNDVAVDVAIGDAVDYVAGYNTVDHTANHLDWLACVSDSELIFFELHNFVCACSLLLFVCLFFTDI